MVNKSWVKIEFDKYSEFTSLKKNYPIIKFNFIYIYIYIYIYIVISFLSS